MRTRRSCARSRSSAGKSCPRSRSTGPRLPRAARCRGPSGLRSSSTERSAEVEPYLRGCAWPSAEWAAYPRCDPGPAGARLPADTRAQAALPVGVRLEFTGDPEAVELDYRTQTAALGLRGAGAGTGFALYRGAHLVGQAPAQLGAGTVRLAAGAGPARGIVVLPEGMRPVVTAIRAIGGAIAPAPPQRRWLCYGDSIVQGWLAAGPPRAWAPR